MEKRIRLTSRNANRRVAKEYDDFGTINQPERTFVDNDKYDKTANELNHPIPDMRKEWREEKRDEANRAARSTRTARLWRIANKSTRLAARFLGDKAPAQMIEDQALDFAMLGEDAIDAALARYNETEDLYKDELPEGQKPATAEGEEKCPECGHEPCVCKGEDKGEEKCPECGQEPCVCKKTAEECSAPSEPAKAEECEVPAEKAESEGNAPMAEELQKPEDNITAEGEDFEVEIGGASVDGAVGGADEDEELNGLFDGKKEAPVAAASKRTAKKGVQTMSQPRRVATASAGVSLEGLWESAPDVSEYFK